MGRSAARLGLTIIGGIVGGYFGYPQLGVMLGGLVGSAVFPDKLPSQQGPRLQDLTIQTSTVGVPVPWVFGTFMVAGNVIWSSGLIETVHKEEVGGKGGGPTQKVTTYSYRVSAAIGLCRGTMAGFKRIWADAKLIYDRSPQGYLETDDEFFARIAASDALEAQLAFYPGDEAQLPDPTIESYEGVGNVQPFRDLCYLVLTDFELEMYGNRLPNFRVEVYENGDAPCVATTEFANEQLDPWLDADDPTNSNNKHEFYVAEVGHGYAGAGRNLGPFDTLGEAIGAASAVSGRGYDYYSGYRTLRGDDAGVVNRIGGKTVADYDVRSVWQHWSSYDYDQQVNRYTNPYGTSLSDYMVEAAGHTLGTRRWSNGMFSQSDWGPGAAVYLSIPWAQSVVPEGYDFIVTGPHDPGGGTYHAVALDALIEVRRVPRPPDNPCNPEFGEPLPRLAGSPDWCILPNGQITPAVDWTLVEDDARVLQKTTYASATNARTVVSKYPLDVIRPQGHADDTQAFWEAAYAEAVARGEMPAGMTYNAGYPVAQQFYYTRSYEFCTADTSGVTLASIVRRICEACGLDPYADIDVSDLEAILVDGYAVPRPNSGREMIEPLRAYGFFDCVESGVVLKFPTRGKAAVATLEADDLGAYPSGETRPAAMTVDRKLEFEMPRQMRVHYARPHVDYEPGQQDSSRLVTGSVHLMDIEVPIAMSDEKAQQIAEVVLFDAWASRNTYATSLDLALLALEPTDCILAPVDGQLERMRIEAIDHDLPGLLRLDLARDDDGSYTSYAVGVPGEAPGSELGFVGPSGMVLLDVPALRDEDDDGGYYAALRPLVAAGAWRGGVIFRSADAGASWAQIGAATTAAAMGRVVSALPSGPHEVWDEGNSLVVELYTGELEGRTEAAVLAGANAAAIGVHGRWEIVQFRDAALSSGVWTLTGLLRGRRGTEWAIGSSEIDDTFVLLSAGGIVRLPLEDAAIGAERQLKVVTIGAAFDASEDVVDFTGEGVALKPFSPVFVRAFREDDGDIVLTWIRRGRLSQEMRSGVDIPLSEDSEAYEVDVLIADAVVRTLAATEQTVTYSLAQQTTDFGSPLPEELTLRVYQLSATVGRGYPAEVTIEVEPVPAFISGPVTFDSDAIIFTGEARETDVNGILSWARQGTGPRLSAGGFVGDGYEARYKGTSLPGWLASSSNAVTLRATIEPYYGSKNATRDVLVHLGVDDATANPKLSLAVIDDEDIAGELQVALRGYTGAVQTQRLCRRNWRYMFPFPQKSDGGLEAVPLGALPIPGTGDVLVSCHFEEDHSRAFLCDRVTGVVSGSFDFDPTNAAVRGLAYRESDGTVWACDSSTGKLLRLDLDASIAAGDAVVDLEWQFTATAFVLANAAWVTIDGTEYLLVVEYRTSGTPYLYVIDPADVTDGGSFNTADRIKRLQLEFYARGISYRDGVLLQSVGVDSPSGHAIHYLDFDGFLADAGSDGDLWSDWLVGIPDEYGPTSLLSDLNADEAGRYWTVTRGRAALSDDQAFYAVWSSALEFSEPNTYQARYNGAGSVEVKINDREFVTLAWTLTAVPGAVTIGGPPATAAGQTAGYASARIRNVVIQSSDLDLEESLAPVIYDTISPDSWAIGLENPGAEAGDGSGWTIEAGDLQVFTTTDIVAGWVDPKFGIYSFYGGSLASSLVRQRFDLEDITEVAAASLEDASLDAWVLVEWWSAGFAAQGDYSRAGVRFLDEDLVELSETYAPALVITPADTFVYRSYSFEVPAGARFVDVLMDMTRVDGTNNNGCWDELIATLVRAPL